MTRPRFLILEGKDAIRAKELEDVHEFLTKHLLEIAISNTHEIINQESFRKTFELLDKALGENAFKRFDGEKYLGGFSLSIFEFLTLGLVKNISQYSDNPNDLERIRAVSKGLRTNDEYKKLSGSGTRAAGRLPTLLTLAKDTFQK